MALTLQESRLSLRAYLDDAVENGKKFLIVEHWPGGCDIADMATWAEEVHWHVQSVWHIPYGERASGTPAIHILFKYRAP